ncbi:MAG: dihydrolipoyl dehydrogenase [Caldisericia bacterium]|nr:dihydrolipoyl dehydrogenase [Caldisericia bacterium]
MEEFDVIVIGGGPGGYVASIRLADSGKKVCLVEKREVGGTCLNRGCIPTKALLYSGEIFTKIKNAENFGIKVKEVNFDIDEIYNYKERIVKKLVSGVEYLLKSRKVVLKKGSGKILDKGVVEIEKNGEKELVKGKDIVIATGSEPLSLKGIEIDHKFVLNSDDALSLREIPKDIVIVGGGAIGIEFANFYNAFGSNVTIVEMMPQLIPNLKDKKVATFIERTLNKKGIKVLTQRKIEKVEIKNDKVYSILDNGDVLETNKVLISIGRKLNTDNIGIENLQINIQNGRVIVDEYLRTNVENFYAIGDIVGGQLFAHKAFKEGEVVAEVISGKDVKINYDVVPWVIFSKPEIASCGLTEDEAKEKGIEVITGEFPFIANGKAVSMNETEGFVKLIGRKDNGKIIGGQIIGPEASNLIAEIALAIKNGLTLKDIGDTIHSHPTLPEVVMEAAKASLGEAIHILNKLP